MSINSHRGSNATFGNPESRLWKPLKLGRNQLSHRVVLAPLTRMRASNNTPNDLHVEYYKQRATEGGLLITEATFISLASSGYPNAPGIWNDKQVKAWKKVTDAVHEKGGIIYCQLWAIGRANEGAMENVKVVSASNLAYDGGKVPEALTIEEIEQYIKDYKQAALNAIDAGFDGVEVHGAHGYLLDQFVQQSSNIREDIYGGSIENRTRFLFEAMDVVSETVGQDRTAVRFSPFTPYAGMGKENPFETWGYISHQIRAKYPKLSYVSFTDPRMDAEMGGTADMNKNTSDHFRAIFRGIDPATLTPGATFEDPNEEYTTVFLSAGGYAISDAEPGSDRTGDLVGFGRFFIANPDLVYRLKNGLEFNAYDRSTFYSPDTEGYTTYPFANAETKKFLPPTKDQLLQEQLDKLSSSFKKLQAENAELKSAHETEFESLKSKIEELENASEKQVAVANASSPSHLEKGKIIVRIKVKGSEVTVSNE